MRALFLSYARTDRTRVEALSNDLEQLGYDVWFDRDLTGGVHWWKGILEAIARSDVFVFVASRDAAQSVACRRELEYAVALGLPILPVATAPLAAIGPLPPFIESLQIVDYSKDTRAEAIKLARALSELPVRGALPDPLPEPPPWPASPISALHYEASSDTSMSLEAQSAWLLRLRDEVGASEPDDGAQEALAHFLRRRDLFRLTGQEAERLAEAWRKPRPQTPPAPAPAQANPKPASKAKAAPKSAAASPPAKQASRPSAAAAWPFPTGNKPDEIAEFADSPEADREPTAPLGSAQATSAQAPRVAPFRYSRLAQVLTVTPLPVLAYLAIAGFDLHHGFWMTGWLLSIWASSGLAGSLTSTLLLVAGGIAIVFATWKIADNQICVSAGDRWTTSLAGLPLTLFIGFTISALLVNVPTPVSAENAVALALLLHLLTQLYLVAID